MTAREREVLTLLVHDLSEKQIARKLHVEPSTVRAHIRNLKLKLGVKAIGGLVRVALEEGLGEDESSEPGSEFPPSRPR